MCASRTKITKRKEDQTDEQTETEERGKRIRKDQKEETKQEPEAKSAPQSEFKEPSFDYGETLIRVNNLSNLISDYSKVYRCVDDVPLVKKLDEIRKRIPCIVVWGSQSSGKSSILNKMFRINCKTGTKITTRCPIEIRVGPEYELTKFYVKKNNHENHEFQSLVEAENYVTNGDELKYDSIVVEAKHERPFIIVDLPGCIDSNNDYFMWLKENYLNRPETTIIHITRGDVDIRTDVSSKYLSGLSNRTISVLTHTDVWLSLPQKINYLDYYVSSSNDVALVNNSDSEDDIIKNFISNDFVKRLRKPPIMGSIALSHILMQCLKEKMKEQIPDIKSTIMKAQKDIDIEFKRIGRMKPDMKEQCYQFKRDMRESIAKEFNESGTTLGINLNKMTGKISPHVFQELKRLVPEPSILEVEMVSGSRKKVQGSEGWDDTIKKYIRIMLNAAKEISADYITEYYSTMAKIIEHKLVNMSIKPCASSARNIIVSDTLKIISETKDDNLKMVDEFLLKAAGVPYCADDNYMDNFHHNIIMKPVIKVIEHFHRASNKASAVEEAYKNKEEFIKMIAGQLPKETKTLYAQKAEHAHGQIVSLWRSQSNGITTEIKNCTNHLEEVIVRKIDIIIDQLTHDIFVELDEVNIQREKLVNIEKLCKEIYDNL